MHQIKQVPEDFLVKEIFNVQAVSNKGNYAYLKLKKREWNTIDAVKAISRKLGISEKDVGFAGSKDKKAVTEQMISIKGIKKARINELKLKDIMSEISNQSREGMKSLSTKNHQSITKGGSLALEFLGYGDKPICLGDLQGNYFEIVIRNLDSFDFKEKSKIINYFDEQRFGRNNIQVGRSIIKNNFQEAVRLIDNEKLNNYLKQKENDFVGALRLLPDRLLKFYVNAYQSYLWNETVKEVLGETLNVDMLPLVGFGTKLNRYRTEVKQAIEKPMLKEGLTFDDFVVRQIPNLSLEGDERRVFVEIRDLKVLEKSDDELNSGMKKIKVSFTLPKGSYATRVVKEMFD